MAGPGAEGSSRRVAGRAGTLVVREHTGPPPPLVLVHGLAGDAGFWDGTVAALGGRHRLIIPELRGHGGSSPPADQAFTISKFADDVLDLFSTLGLERLVLVGHSFGASVAMEAAARIPDRVAGLIVLDGAGDFSLVPRDAMAQFLGGMDDDETYAATLDDTLEVSLKDARPDTERRVRAAMLAAPRPMVRAMYHSLLAYQPIEALDRFQGPKLLVTTPVNAADFALHALRPGLPCRRMTGVSHWLMLDDPQETASIVEGFLGATG